MLKLMGIISLTIFATFHNASSEPALIFLALVDVMVIFNGHCIFYNVESSLVNPNLKLLALFLIASHFGFLLFY